MSASTRRLPSTSRTLWFVSSSLPLDLPALEPDLARVEAALRQSVANEDAFLTEVAQSLIIAGGKRIRPVLALAAAYSGVGAASDDVVQGAVAVELVHLGSLYHDDVMDEADTRRGIATANARYGNFVAIVAGDFCLAKSAQIAASLGVEVSALLGFTIGRLCEGQVGELQTLFNPDRPEAAYRSSIDGKTASLMSTACRIGALTSDLPRDQVDALTVYGQRIGMVFQIVDDILDLVATDEELGKPAGNDVVEGVYTLPLLRALADPAVGDELRAMIGGPVERSAVDQIRKLVRASNGVESAVYDARLFADEAREAMAAMPAGRARTELAGFGHVLIDRLTL